MLLPANFEIGYTPQRGVTKGCFVMTKRSALILFEPIPRPMRFWVRNLVGSEEPDTQNYGFAGTWIMPPYVRRSPTRSRSDRQSNTRSVLAICSIKKPAYGAYSPAVRGPVWFELVGNVFFL